MERFGYLARTRLPGARWVSAHNCHLTLAFFGALAEDRVRDLCDALTTIRAAPFRLKAGELGIFGSGKRPRSLHLRIERSKALSGLRNAVRSRATGIGLSLRRQQFVPHITLARFAGHPQPDGGARLASLLARRPPDLPAPAIADFALYESIPGRKETHYRTLARYGLEMHPAGE